MPMLRRPRAHTAFVELTEGELTPAVRAACESTLFSSLEKRGIVTDLVAINPTGCFFTVDDRHAAGVRVAAAPLNVARHLRCGCERLTLSRVDGDWPLPSIADVLGAFAAHGIDLIHVTAHAAAVDVIVAETGAAAAAAILTAFCRPTARTRSA